MNELQLLKRLVSLEKENYELKIKLEFRSDEKDVRRLKEKLADLKRELIKTEKELSEVTDFEHSRIAWKAMIKQLTSYVTEINKARAGLNLSRNQGLMLENHLFSGILQDLNYFITGEIYGYRVPAHLIYTYSDEGSVKIKDLTSFLNSEISTLSSIEDPNYIKLRKFYRGFQERIQDRFIN